MRGMLAETHDSGPLQGLKKEHKEQGKDTRGTRGTRGKGNFFFSYAFCASCVPSPSRWFGQNFVDNGLA
jgi:hypothetical protein